MQIFLLDTEEQSRSEADGQAWKEDAQWARILDQEWDLQAVKQVRACTSRALLLPHALWIVPLPFWHTCLAWRTCEPVILPLPCLVPFTRGDGEPLSWTQG